MRTKMIRQLLWLPALLILLTIAAGCGDDGGADSSDSASAGRNDGEAPRGVLLDEPVPAPDFELVTHEGEPFRMSEQQGNAVAVFFGYTGCPDVCPLTLAHMADAHEQLGGEGANVTYLLITVDPEGDDLDKLGRYVSRIDAPLVGLTGSRDELESVWKDYDITVERHERDNGTYLIDHSAQIWLVSPDGEVVMFLPMGADGDDLAIDLQWLLDQGG